MPSKSTKQQLRELALMLGINELCFGVNSREVEVTADNDNLLLLTLLDLSRYTCNRVQIPKSIHWLETVLGNQDFDDGRFRMQLRMDRQAFWDILKLIQVDEAFSTSQEPVALQLAVALFNFGTFGNASSFGQIGTKFGVSEGTVENFTKRTIKDLNNLSATWIRWPDRQERIQISNHMLHDFLPKCIGFVDGSDADFYQAPADDKETYWSRKKKYCMQFQIICDPFKFIRSLYTGFPGSVHDARVYAASPTCVQPELYFSEGEYIIGDTAYTKSETVVVPYKRYQGQLGAKQKIFNTHISSKRVYVEHTIGILKGRFQSLRGLRIIVDKVNGHAKVCNWIQACVVLHNILMKRDPWIQPNDEVYTEPDNLEHHIENGFMNSNFQNSGEMKRNCVKEIICAMCT